MDYAAQHAEAHRQCLSTNAAVPPEKLLNISADSSDPVRPGTRHWPKVIAAYDEYWKAVCERPTREEYLAVIAASYAKAMSDADLKESLRFLATPAGTRLVAAGSAVVRDVYQEWQRLNAASLPAAIAALNLRLEAIGMDAAREACQQRNRGEGRHLAASSCAAEPNS